MPDNLLVPGRDCDGCTECCHALSIDAPTLTKPNGINCPNNCGSGCTVYAVRPNVCRDWYCAWRMSETLGDEWRPDRSGFIVEIVMDDLPEGFSLPGLRFTLLRSTANILWPPFVDLVTRAIAIRQPVFLCLIGPPGHLPAKSFLNIPAFVAAVDASDEGAIRHCLKRAGERLEMHHWERKSA
jgi:hypothetical protein